MVLSAEVVNSSALVLWFAADGIAHSRFWGKDTSLCESAHWPEDVKWFDRPWETKCEATCSACARGAMYVEISHIAFRYWPLRFPDGVPQPRLTRMIEEIADRVFEVAYGGADGGADEATEQNDAGHEDRV